MNTKLAGPIRDKPMIDSARAVAYAMKNDVVFDHAASGFAQKRRAVIDRPYNLRSATAGALYERPRNEADMHG